MDARVSVFACNLLAHFTASMGGCRLTAIDITRIYAIRPPPLLALLLLLFGCNWEQEYFQLKMQQVKWQSGWRMADKNEERVVNSMVWWMACRVKLFCLCLIAINWGSECTLNCRDLWGCGGKQRRGSVLSGLSNCGERKSVRLGFFCISLYYYFTAEEWTSFLLLPQSLSIELRTLYMWLTWGRVIRGWIGIDSEWHAIQLAFKWSHSPTFIIQYLDINLCTEFIFLWLWFTYGTYHRSVYLIILVTGKWAPPRYCIALFGPFNQSNETDPVIRLSIDLMGGICGCKYRCWRPTCQLHSQ